MKLLSIMGAAVGATLGVMWMNKRKAKKETEKAQQDQNISKDEKTTPDQK